jgi:hypothetical protein
MEHTVEIIERDLETYTVIPSMRYRHNESGVWKCIIQSSTQHGKVFTYISKSNIQISTHHSKHYLYI